MLLPQIESIAIINRCGGCHPKSLIALLSAHMR